MTIQEIEMVEQLWPNFSSLVFVPHTDQEYDQLVHILDSLIDVVGEEETHPLASLMEIFSVLIETYEDDHVPELAAY